MPSLSIVIASLGLVSTAVSEPPRRPAYRQVHADVVNLREGPSADASIVARLPINSTVLEESRQDGFSRVQVRSPQGDGLVGFIDSSLLGDALLTVEDCLERASKAQARNDAANALSWAERAVAIVGDHSEALELVARLSRKLGREQRARWAEAALRGDRPIYLALCRGGSAEVVARYQRQEGLAPPEAAATLAPGLAILPWFRLLSDGTAGWEEHRPFVFARAVPLWGEPASEVTETTEAKVVLGPCAQDGALYASATLETVAETRFDWKRAPDWIAAISRAAAAGAPFRAVTVTAHRFTPGPWATVQVTGSYTTSAETQTLIGRPTLDLSFWALLRVTETKAKIVIGATGGTFQSVGTPTHARIKASGAVLVMVPNGRFKPESASGDFVTTVAVERDGRVRELHQQLSGSGD